MEKSLAGKVAVVTGANTGIGRVTAIELARQGARVYLACRSEEKTRPVIDAIRAEHGEGSAHFLPLDLASFVSVRAAAAEFLGRERALHLLINNAGLAGPRGLTEDGFELLFGVNHLGHFLFTELLRERLVQSAPARIVLVASRAHYRAKGIDYAAVRQPTRTRTTFHEYCVSKLANVMHTRGLAKRLQGTGVTAYSVHPGAVASDIWRKVPAPLRVIAKLFMRTNEEGARTTLYCATAPELAGASGGYYADSRERTASAIARDDAQVEQLWSESLRMVGL